MTEQDDLDPANLASVCHERWVMDLHRAMDSADYQDSWRAEQCGACRYFAPMIGPLGSDWGACCNARSPFDRRVMFEHDGCAEFRIGGPDGLQPFTTTAFGPRLRGSHEVAIQAGSWGHYAIVELELEVHGGGRGLRVTYAQLDQPWRAGAAFGIAYAFERSGVKWRGADVGVRLAGHIVDTTEAVVAYAAARAFFAAVNVAPPPGLRLDEATAEIVFPK